MKKLSFKTKMGIIIISQVLLILLVIGIFFYSMNRLGEINTSQANIQKEIKEAINMVFSIQEYENGRTTFIQLKDQFEKGLAQNPDGEIKEKIENMMLQLDSFNIIHVENTSIKQEILKITESSIQNSNNYIQLTGQRLVDLYGRRKVGTMERSFITGSLFNTNATYRLREVFNSLANNKDNRDLLINHIDSLQQNTERNLNSVRGTQFEEMVKYVKSSNLKIKDLSLKYIANLELGDSIQSSITEQLSSFISLIQNESDNSAAASVKNFLIVIEFSATLFFLFLIFTVTISFIIIRNTLSLIGTEPNSLSKIAENISNGLLSNSKVDNGTKGIYKSVLIMNDKLAEIVKKVQSNIVAISGASTEIRSNSHQVSKAATQQANSSEELSSTMEEITSKIQQSAENAKLTEKVAQTVSTMIQRSSMAMTNTIEAMKGIAEKTAVIDEIAFKTNILSLNASVEAANAGKYGKGFGVVAKEVSKLAEQSKLAAQEIEVFTQSSVEIAMKSGKILEELVPELDKTLHMVSEIHNASNEQKAGAYEINSSLLDLNNISQINATSAEEMDANINELVLKANELNELVSFFKFSK